MQAKSAGPREVDRDRHRDAVPRSGADVAGPDIAALYLKHKDATPAGTLTPHLTGGVALTLGRLGTAACQAGGGLTTVSSCRSGLHLPESVLACNGT